MFEYMIIVNYILLIILLILNIYQYYKKNKDNYSHKNNLKNNLENNSENIYYKLEPKLYDIPEPVSQGGPNYIPQQPYYNQSTHTENYPIIPGPHQPYSNEMIQSMDTPYENAYGKNNIMRQTKTVQKSYNKLPDGMLFSPQDAYNKFDSASLF